MTKCVFAVVILGAIGLAATGCGGEVTAARTQEPVEVPTAFSFVSKGEHRRPDSTLIVHAVRHNKTGVCWVIFNGGGNDVFAMETKPEVCQ